MDEIFRLRKWIGYQWRAKTKYYLHSPFVYQFYLNVLEGKPDINTTAIKSLRHELKKNNSVLKCEDYGTGSGAQRKISELESKVAVRPKYGKVLYRLTQYFKPNPILELGASIGLSSAYLALGNRGARIITIEGSTPLIAIAKINHSKLNITNVEIRPGNFDNCLADALDDIATAGLVFFDGNHRKEATLRYFEQCLTKAGENSIFIFDDIHRSPEMNEAWEAIKRHPDIKLTIDIFQLGICFFISSKLAKEDFVLRYP